MVERGNSFFYALYVPTELVFTASGRWEGQVKVAQGMFKLKDNARRWMECHHPPWTGLQLAEKLGYDDSFVSQVFSGQKQPSWEFLKRLARLTGLQDGGELIYFDPDGAEEGSPRAAGGRKGVKPHERNGEGESDGPAQRRIRKRPGVGGGKRRVGRDSGAGDPGGAAGPVEVSTSGGEASCA